MSGTSLDGLDIALCAFCEKEEEWEFRIEKAITIPYSSFWKKCLQSLPSMCGEELISTHYAYGRFLGLESKIFIESSGIPCDFISSHGHTVFHNPAAGHTFQAGDGGTIAAISGLTVVYDFRSKDIEYGGQGAPLVPIGDKLLFGEYDACLNIGGFSNISYESDGKRIAFDISPANKVLNHYASLLGKEYDDKGSLARKGLLIYPLLNALNNLSFYSVPPPKSLGEEWMLENVFPLTESYVHRPYDLLRTITEHIAMQIAIVISNSKAKTVLTSGGGAYNTFLIERINALQGSGLILPDDLIINYKEAMIFAFLGLLRMENRVNILSSVTGAVKDHCSGLIAIP